MHHYRTGLLAVLGISCLVAVLASGCGHAISRGQEIRMGREAGDYFEAGNGGLDCDPVAEAAIQQIAARLAPVAKPPDYPYEVRVLLNYEVNAVAFPGGRIYVYRGLIEAFDRDPDKIAWVLGHELRPRRTPTRRHED